MPRFIIALYCSVKFITVNFHSPLHAIIQVFMIFFAAECAFMHAVAMGSMKLDMIRTPFYMFLAQFIYVVTLYASPALM